MSRLTVLSRMIDTHSQRKLFNARNLHEALAVSRDLGWRVVGACSGPNSITSTALGSDTPTILVMVRRPVLRIC